MSAPDLHPISRTLGGGRYLLERPLGQGGMASVWRTFDCKLGVFRALKLLNPEVSDRKSIRERLAVEGRTMALLHHPNIVSLHDVGEEGEQVFLVMELLLGGSLMDRVHGAGALKPRMACEVMRGVLAGLTAAHDQGIIHRDVKPHNVLLDLDGTPKVTDFGIARIEDHSTTKTGAVMGTLAYMPPEQRASARKVDARSDVFAAGATLYAIATGREPFDLYATAIDPQLEQEFYGDIPDPLARVIRKAAHFRMEDRYPSAEAMSDALEAAIEALPEDPPGMPLVSDSLSDAARQLALDARAFATTLSNSGQTTGNNEGSPSPTIVSTDGDSTRVSESTMHVDGIHEATTDKEPAAVRVAIPPDEPIRTPTVVPEAPKGPPWLLLLGMVAAMCLLGLLAVGAIAIAYTQTQPEVAVITPPDRPPESIAMPPADAPAEPIATPPADPPAEPIATTEPPAQPLPTLPTRPPVAAADPPPTRVDPPVAVVVVAEPAPVAPPEVVTVAAPPPTVVTALPTQPEVTPPSTPPVATVAPVAAPADDLIGKWKLVVEGPKNSPTSASATVKADAIRVTTLTGPTDVRPVLTIACRNGSLSATVDARVPLEPIAVEDESPTPDTQILLGYDVAPTAKSKAKSSGTVVTLPGAKKFALEAVGHNTFGFGFTPSGGSAVAVEFDIRRMSEVLAPIRASCAF